MFDWNFWAPTTIAFISAIITAVIAYLKEDNPKIKWWVILIPICVAIASVIFSWIANQEDKRALKRSHDNDSTYRSKFEEEIGVSKTIIDNLNTTLKTVKINLDSTRYLLKQQKEAGVHFQTN